jgi:hypothetical protein
MTPVLPEKGGDILAKKLLARSLVDPGVASRKPSPTVVSTPPVATFLLVEVFHHLEGRGVTKTTTNKMLALPMPC